VNNNVHCIVFYTKHDNCAGGKLRNIVNGKQ